MSDMSVSELVNWHRFQDRMPAAGHTVRLTEVLAVLAEKTEGE